ncbi:MAG: energy-coupled thiamine transporter ThiT [Clostridia bacterium]|nr:energy-coupled thiamine transporter ThiT [Clostridia bacterium]
MSDRKSSVYRLTESAILLAVAAVLSVLKIVDMPYGGSITAFSMLPLLIIAYRHGTRWGLFTAFTYSLIQLLLGLDNFSYATSFLAVVMIALFDYLLAFFALGLGGAFRKKLPQGAALGLAAIVSGVLRYLCHVISGCTVWAGLSVPTKEAVVYSLSYNATYMIPEIVILVLGSVYVSRLLSLDGAGISRATVRRTDEGKPSWVLSSVAYTLLLITTVGDVVYIAPALQNASSGELFFTGLATLNWLGVAIFTAVGVALFAILRVIATRVTKK